MRKKKILFHSNHCKSMTGFGRNAKAVLKYLFATGKYDIIEYATGIGWSNPNLKTLPWKAYGTLPDTNEEWDQIQQNPGLARAVHYGAKYIDKLILQEKPDLYIGVEDIWCFNGFFDKKWWNKINCVIHTTLDSEPILPMAIDAASKIKNYFVWAEFAKREMHKLGHKHVEKIYGAFDTDDFFRLSDELRFNLRKNNGITPNSFIVGFVFRNQLRKSVPQLLDGFKKFLEKHPDAKLLLHTCWSEEPSGSWDIPRLIKERGIDPSKVLSTYICPKCGNYEIRPFAGENIDCRFCGQAKCMVTTRPQIGVTEAQLNEIYNLMDVYCHPFTSGGQEMPIQEAKLTELITLVTNYSCGEEYCLPENGGFSLDWEPYYEVGTQFIKATTLPSSIFSQLEKVYKMSPIERKKMGEKARKFVIDNFSVEVIGKKWEKIIDDFPYIVNPATFKIDDYQ